MSWRFPRKRREKAEEKQYRFAVLKFQPRLSASVEPEPIAIILEGESLIYALGRYPEDVEAVSELGQHFVEDLPYALLRELKEALEHGQDVFEHFTRSHQWNVFLSPPQSLRSELSIRDLAFRLFAQHVELQASESYAEPEILSAEPIWLGARQRKSFTRPATASSY